MDWRSFGEIFAERENHINGIENFLSQAKRVLQYNGINRKKLSFILEGMNFGLTLGHLKYSLKPFENGVKFRANLPSPLFILACSVLKDLPHTDFPL